MEADQHKALQRYENMRRMLELSDKDSVADVGTLLRHLRTCALERKQFALAGSLWGAIDAREKMLVAIGESIARLDELISEHS